MRAEAGRRGIGRVRCAIAAGCAGLALFLPAAAQAQQPFGCRAFQLGNETTGCIASEVAEDGRDGLGIGHGGGAAIPGTSSALGRRFGATPRVAVAGRVGFVRFDRQSAGAWDGRGRSDSGLSPVFGASVGVGLFDGFSPAPTASGLLGVDLIGDVSTVRLPSGDGFESSSLAWGYGVRIGLLRESFTLPGASVSIMRRSGASYVMEGERGSLDADVTTTSVRATVGKDLLGFGVHAGVGWDRTSTEGLIRVDGAGGPPVELPFEDEQRDNTVFFGGIARTFLVTTLGADVGWSGDVVFGSLSVRLTI